MNLLHRIGIVLTLIASLSINAQSLIPQSNEKGRWGYADDSGTLIIKCNYDEALPFDNGIARVRKGDNWGMINSSGKEILPIKYNLIDKFAPGIFRIAADGKMKDGVLLDEKYGFANSEGQILLKPEYNEIGQFKDGLAYINKGDMYGYINDKIEIIIPCKFKAVGSFNNDGYTWVCDGGKPDKENPSKFVDGKIGIYDRTGKILIPVKYASVGIYLPFQRKENKEKEKKLSLPVRTVLTESGSHHLYAKYFIRCNKFSDLKEGAVGFWMSNNSDGIKNGITDLNGNILIPENKYQHAWYPTDGLAMIQLKKGWCQYNYLDMSTGKLLLDENSADGWAFKNGYAVIRRPDIPVKKGEKAAKNYYYSIIDTNGYTVSNQYGDIFPENYGVHVVKNGSVFGLIGADGHLILDVNNYAIYPPAENRLLLRRVSEKDQIGYVDLNGQWVIQPQYVSGYSFKHGWAAVKSDEGWGYIDSIANIKVPLKWYSVRFISSPEPEVVFVDTSSESGSIPYNVATQSLLGTTGYKFIRDFGRDFEGGAIVGSDVNHTGIINRNGDTIIPTLFPIETTRSAYRKYIDKGKTEWTETDTYRTKLLNDSRCNKGRLNQKLESTVWDY